MVYRVAFVILIIVLAASMLLGAVRGENVWVGLIYGAAVGVLLDVILGAAAAVVTALVRQVELARTHHRA
jgi:hypothetical protein